MEEIEVLSLGLNFCVEVIKDVNIFARNLLLKIIYTKETNQGSFQSSTASNAPTLVPMDALNEEFLELLQDPLMESQIDATQNFDDKEPPTSEHKINEFKNRSTKFPSLQLNPNILTFAQQVIRENVQISHYGRSTS